MASWDFSLSLLACFQPLVIGLLAFFGLGRLLPLASITGRYLGNVRTGVTAFRFFECATYSRLSSRLHYNMQVFSICVAFLLYDVDFFFFFAEATHLESNSVYELWLILVFFALLVYGLWFDYMRFGYEWAF